jgi:hypothetical protein
LGNLDRKALAFFVMICRALYLTACYMF